jgi:hypothetical protein
MLLDASRNAQGSRHAGSCRERGSRKFTHSHTLASLSCTFTSHGHRARKDEGIEWGCEARGRSDALCAAAMRAGGDQAVRVCGRARRECGADVRGVRARHACRSWSLRQGRNSPPRNPSLHSQSPVNSIVTCGRKAGSANSRLSWGGSCPLKPTVSFSR